MVVVKRRLLNPAKSDVGRISKAILQKVNLDIIEKTGLKLCRSTGQVLEWYKGLLESYKGDMLFLLYDIEDYYPSIKPELLSEALKFAKKFTTISDQDIEIITQARKSFLFCNKEPWIKRDKNNNNFDVPQGSFDSCEVCELCGLFLLSETSKFVPQANNILYRDDGLILLNAPSQDMERIAQKLIKTYKKHGLKVVVEKTTAKVVNYLDIKLDLNNRTHRAFKKPNDHPVYVNSRSNHPPAVLKSLPKNINDRLSMLAHNKTVFEEDKIVYQNALNEAGYKFDLNYKEDKCPKNKTRNRGRPVCWFNPPWSSHVKTPVGKMFLQLVDQYFPRTHPLHKYFNRNTLKMSYCTCKNLKSHLDAHNRAILQPRVISKASCNCKTKFKKDCPLPGECLTSNLIYQCDIIVGNDEEKKTYFGQTQRPFKQRYYEHNTAMKNPNSKLATALSNYVWKLKNANKQFRLKWSIKSRASTYHSGARKCQLCLKEKTAIALADPDQLLNSRTELLQKCHHLINFELRKHNKVPP